MLQFYQQLAEILISEKVVLATLIDSKGSVPREIGAKMLICESGRIIDTIGGGAGEAKVIHQAQQVLETGRKQFVEIDLSGATNRETQGICGGWMKVWLERWQGEDYLHLAHSIITQLKSGKTLYLATPFDSEKAPYLTTTQLPLDGFSEEITPPPLLLIVGAGHVGEQLAKVAHLIGFEIAVQDDRIEWANLQRYPEASHVFNQDIDTALAQLVYHSQLYAALVTRGYQYDLEALTTLINRSQPCQYIGMIGSQKRVKKVFQTLLNSSLNPPNIPKIYAPIGLDIGALTPEEIAVSIAAELILVRRQGTGKPLSQRQKSRIHTSQS